MVQLTEKMQTAPNMTVSLYADFTAGELLIFSDLDAHPADRAWCKPYIDLASGGMPVQCYEPYHDGLDLLVVRIAPHVLALQPRKPERHLRLVYSA
jgi:hypothetical protein